MERQQRRVDLDDGGSSGRRRDARAVDPRTAGEPVAITLSCANRLIENVINARQRTVLDSRYIGRNPAGWQCTKAKRDLGAIGMRHIEGARLLKPGIAKAAVCSLTPPAYRSEFCLSSGSTIACGRAGQKTSTAVLSGKNVSRVWERPPIRNSLSAQAIKLATSSRVVFSAVHSCRTSRSPVVAPSCVWVRVLDLPMEFS